jgi:hypothetical protein
MIESILLFFGVCFMGVGECYESDLTQEIDELLLRVITTELEVFDYDQIETYYKGNGCLQHVGENPHWVDPEADDNYGMVRGSQGWYDGKLWRTLNGTVYTVTLCSPDVLDAFEKNPYWLKDRTYEKLDMTFGDVYYDGNHTKGSGFMRPCTELTTMERGCS